MLDPQLLIHTRPARRSLVVAAAGELDFVTAPRLRATVTQAVDDGWDDLVLDLRGMTFCDSAGLHLLLDLRDRADRDGLRCAIGTGARRVERLLAVAGLEDVLPRVDVDVLPT